jgi:hypothetical protein
MTVRHAVLFALRFSVRRWLAILLVAVFSLPLVTPAFSGDSDTNMPACCRRNGKHHCAETGAGSPQSGQGFRSTARCPSYPRVVLPFGGPCVFPLQANSTQALEHTSAQRLRQAHTSLGTSDSRAHQKRGPPSSFSPTTA